MPSDDATIPTHRIFFYSPRGRGEGGRGRCVGVCVCRGWKGGRGWRGGLFGDDWGGVFDAGGWRCGVGSMVTEERRWGC